MQGQFTGICPRNEEYICDDLYVSENTTNIAKETMDHVDHVLEDHSMKSKGWTDDPLSDKLVRSGGMLFKSVEDKLIWCPPTVHNGAKDRGQIAKEKFYSFVVEDRKRKRSIPPELIKLDIKLGERLTKERVKEVFINTRKTLRVVSTRLQHCTTPLGCV